METTLGFLVVIVIIGSLVLRARAGGADVGIREGEIFFGVLIVGSLIFYA